MTANPILATVYHVWAITWTYHSNPMFLGHHCGPAMAHNSSFDLEDAIRFSSEDDAMAYLEEKAPRMVREAAHVERVIFTDWK